MSLQFKYPEKRPMLFSWRIEKGLFLVVTCGFSMAKDITLPLRFFKAAQYVAQTGSIDKK